MIQPNDRAEFERIKAATRGTVRIERAEDYVIIAHCQTAQYFDVAPMSITVWYVSVNFNGMPIKRREFDRTLSYDALEAFIVATISAHQKTRQTAPAAR